MIKNSIKQLFRTPMRTLLYFLLIIFVGILFSLGLNLWAYNQNKIDVYEKHFKTVGTFEQEYNVIEKIEEWDAAIGDYRIRQEKTYGELIREEDLMFEGANYIKKPEFRPAILAYAPEYFPRYSMRVAPSVMEFEALEDVTPEECIPVKITKMLTEQYEGVTYNLNENENVFVCQHFTKNPVPLEKGKTYVAMMGANIFQEPHGDHAEEYIAKYAITETQWWGEYVPYPLESSQTDIYGREVSGPMAVSEINEDTPSIYEVTEGFYKTEIGIRYMEYVKGESMIVPSLSVLGTSATQLLLSFHEGNAYIKEGRDISTEEYSKGSKVCLVSELVAQSNELKPGDMIDLDFWAVSFGDERGSGNVINAQAKAYDVYLKEQYKIVGVYKDDTAYYDYTPFTLFPEVVVVPRRSIKEVDYSQNISSYSPMGASNTSFQIENGKIDSFMGAFNKSGLEDKMNVVFYDGGYSQLETGINQMKVLSLVFLAMGVVLMIFIIILFTNIYISNNIIRTMIERTLGITKAKCMLSLLSGVVLIIVIGSLAGGVIGGIASEKLVASSTFEDYYKRDFSRNVISLSDKELEEVDSLISSNQILVVYTAISIGILIVFGILVAFIKAMNNIKQEPLKLLSKRTE